MKVCSSGDKPHMPRVPGQLYSARGFGQSGVRFVTFCGFMTQSWPLSGDSGSRRSGFNRVTCVNPSLSEAPRREVGPGGRLTKR